MAGLKNLIIGAVGTIITLTGIGVGIACGEEAYRRCKDKFDENRDSKNIFKKNNKE